MLPNRFPHVNAAINVNHCITIILLFVLFAASSHAGTWRDSFEDGILNGWRQPGHSRLGEIVGYKVHWTTGNDRLNVQVLDIPLPPLAPSPPFKPAPGPSRLFKPALTFLEFTAFRLEEEHLVVGGAGMVERFMTFGIAIGQHYPPGDRRTGIVYLFGSRGQIKKVSFSRSGSFSGRKTAEIDYVNPKIKETGYLKVIFNAGHFQVYSADGLKATMVDLDYETVDLVGIMIWGEVPGAGSLDEFVISGPCIPNGTGNVSNQPADKLVTRWACIKRRSGFF